MIKHVGKIAGGINFHLISCWSLTGYFERLAFRLTLILETERNLSAFSSSLIRCNLLVAKVKVTKEGILVPEQLFREMIGTYVKMEQILATLEELADDEALKAIEKSKKQVAEGEYVECSINDLEKVLK